MVLTQDHI